MSEIPHALQNTKILCEKPIWFFFKHILVFQNTSRIKYFLECIHHDCKWPAMVILDDNWTAVELLQFRGDLNNIFRQNTWPNAIIVYYIVSFLSVLSCIRIQRLGFPPGYSQGNNLVLYNSQGIIFIEPL